MLMQRAGVRAGGGGARHRRALRVAHLQRLGERFLRLVRVSLLYISAAALAHMCSGLQLGQHLIGASVAANSTAEAEDKTAN